MIQVKFHFELSHHLLNCWSSSIIDCYHYPLQNEQANPWISATEDLVLMCLLTTDGYAVSEGDLVAHLALQEADQHPLTGVTPWKPWQLQWQLPVCSLAVPQSFWWAGNQCLCWTVKHCSWGSHSSSSQRTAAKAETNWTSSSLERMKNKGGTSLLYKCSQRCRNGSPVHLRPLLIAVLVVCCHFKNLLACVCKKSKLCFF